ncbi:hypothetical protein PILCRDRAFT_823813 [Piloderma croceum F 1598]|uniref:Transmembrane protein n=1 Tax=Piloderma croceum (strain F 1598) TaxID=765440 RepID=A0A0C3FHF7_PILCF|nr:hypothetical protein PILCRDRAFT_823813 [Piloderma croceum F 1598]
MSLTVLAVTTCLLVGVSAQNISSKAQCQSTYGWMNNSINQSPCLVSAYLSAPCFGGVYTVASISPGLNYYVPGGNGNDTCTCSTVTYSMVAACSLCQGALAGNWSIWSAKCSKPSLRTYTNMIPKGTVIQPWAYLDVTLGNTINVTAVELEAEAEGFTGVPGLTPSTFTTTATVTSISISSTSHTSSTSILTTSASSTASSGSSSSPSHVGAIAGGAAGAFVALGVIGTVITVCRSRQRRNQRAPSSEYSIHNAQPVDVSSQSPPLTLMTQGNHHLEYDAWA